MKPSKYNYIFSREGYSFWYNGLTHAYFKVCNPLGEKLHKYLESGYDILEREAPQFYKRLCEGGFLQEDDLDELELAIRLNEEDVARKDYMLTIIPTLNCNFACSYCIQKHIPTIMSEDVKQRIYSHINHMIENEGIRSLNLEWFGGEPFMMLKPIVEPISTYAKKKCKAKGIPFRNSGTTNAYFLTPDKIPILKVLEFVQFQITLDGPRDMHNKVKFQKGLDSAFDHALENIKQLLNHIPTLSILLRINYTKDNFTLDLIEQVDEYLKDCDKRRINILLKKVWQEEMDNMDYDRISKLANHFTSRGYHVDQSDLIAGHVPCYVNRKYYNTINFNGKVLKCTACDDLYDYTKGGDLLEDGSITWKDNLDEKCIAKAYDNETCLGCKYLPVCYGICPRDFMKGQNYCKLKVGMDIETRIFNLINMNYELHEATKKAP